MMNDSEIDALAKGMVPFVRECVTEAFTMIVVPSALAEQVKTAIHLLHESPPIVQRNAPPSASPLPPPRPSRIERDESGGYKLIYDEPQT
jgi:hypothetical protein